MRSPRNFRFVLVFAGFLVSVAETRGANDSLTVTAVRPTTNPSAATINQIVRAEFMERFNDPRVNQEAQKEGLVQQMLTFKMGASKEEGGSIASIELEKNARTGVTIKFAADGTIALLMVKLNGNTTEFKTAAAIQAELKSLRLRVTNSAAWEAIVDGGQRSWFFPTVRISGSFSSLGDKDVLFEAKIRPLGAATATSAGASVLCKIVPAETLILRDRKSFAFETASTNALADRRHPVIVFTGSDGTGSIIFAMAGAPAGAVFTWRILTATGTPIKGSPGTFKAGTSQVVDDLAPGSYTLTAGKPGVPLGTFARRIAFLVIRVQIQVNNTPTASDDLVRLKSVIASDPPAITRFKTPCRIRLLGSNTELPIVLANPDGRLRFPENPTQNLDLPANGAWVPFEISGEEPSLLANDSVISVGVSGSSLRSGYDKTATVFWFKDPTIEVKAQGTYALVNVGGQQFYTVPAASGVPAVSFAASARLMPVAIDGNAPQIAPLRIGIVQNVKPAKGIRRYSNPVIEWDPDQPAKAMVTNGNL